MSSEPSTYHHGDLELRGEVHRPTTTANGAAVLVVHEADGIGATFASTAAGSLTSATLRRQQTCMAAVASSRGRRWQSR